MNSYVELSHRVCSNTSIKTVVNDAGAGGDEPCGCQVNTTSSTSPSNAELAKIVAQNWAKLQEINPLIHCMTNYVVQNFTANIVLAAGAAPAMVEAPNEAGLFATIASALLINTGTMTHLQMEEMRAAAVAAHESGTPWVLDPVAVGALPVRTEFAAQILQHQPTLIRGNASEILGLSRAVGGPGQSSGRGVDSGDDVESAVEAAKYLIERYQTAVAISGPVDLLIDAERQIRCGNGHPLLTKVTGGGCALGAYLAAFLTTSSDVLQAAAAGHACYGLAAQKAAELAKGPGSFAVNLLDELANLNAASIEEGAQLW